METDKRRYLLLQTADEDDEWLIVNPPENLEELLAEWRKLDIRWNNRDIEEAYYDRERREYVPNSSGNEWMPVGDWLKHKGLEVHEPRYETDAIFRTYQLYADPDDAPDDEEE